MSNLSITIKGHEISPEELEFIKKNNIHSVIIFLWNIKNGNFIEAYYRKKLCISANEEEFNNFFLNKRNKKDLIEVCDKIINKFLTDNKIFDKDIDNIINKIIDESKKSLKELIKSIKSINANIKVGIDCEGGLVYRLPWSKYNYKPQNYYGSIYDSAKNDEERKKILEEFRKRCKNIADELSEFGINMNLGPVLDLNESEFIKSSNRAFSNNIETIFDLALVFIEEMLKKNIICVLKHFPGHGRAEDTHLSIIKIKTTEEELRASEIKPYELIYEKFTKDFKNEKIFVMISHVLYSSIDPENIATFSSKIIDLAKSIMPSAKFMTDSLTMSGCIDIVKKQFPEILDDELLQKSLEEAQKAGFDIMLACDDKGVIQFLKERPNNQLKITNKQDTELIIC